MKNSSWSKPLSLLLVVAITLSMCVMSAFADIESITLNNGEALDGTATELSIKVLATPTDVASKGIADDKATWAIYARLTKNSESAGTTVTLATETSKNATEIWFTHNFEVTAGEEEITWKVEIATTNNFANATSATIKQAIASGDNDENTATAPILTGGTGKRKTETTATIGFKTSTPGTGYYIVKDSGDSASEKPSSPFTDWTSLSTVEGTVSNKEVTLTAGNGAKVVYVVVVADNGLIRTPYPITVEAYEGGGGTGGDNTGGDNTGGDNTGGDNTGGSNTGGSNTGGSSSDSSNSSSSSSGGGGGSSGGATTPTTPQPVTVAQAVSAVNSAVNGVATLRNVTEVALSTLQAMVRAAGARSITINADSRAPDGSIDVRIVFNPAEATRTINLSASTLNSPAVNARATFARSFSNTLSTVSLSHTGAFGMNLRVAAKLNPALRNSQNLVFYVYNPQTNKYNRLQTTYRIDANGFIHFTTNQGGVVIISNGTLAKK